MILVELGERVFEGEFTACDLQALDQIACAHEQYAPSVLDERKPDGCREMALAAADRSSDILPGIRATAGGSIIRFTRGVGRRRLSFGVSVSKVETCSSSINSMERVVDGRC
jgi:hypothetical protein